MIFTFDINLYYIESYDEIWNAPNFVDYSQIIFVPSGADWNEDFES